MDMLVKLYALPDSRGVFERLQKAGITTRRALAPEKHKVIAWVREHFSEAWASEADVAFSREPVSCFIAISPPFVHLLFTFTLAGVGGNGPSAQRVVPTTGSSGTGRPEKAGEGRDGYFRPSGR